MNRMFLLTMLAASLLFPANRAFAQDDAKAWLQFLEGDWDWEATDGNGGSLAYASFGEELALSVRFTGRKDNSTALAVLGWNPEQNALVELGYNSQGAVHRAQFRPESAELIQGSWSSKAGENTASSKFTMTRVNDHAYTIEVKEAKRNGEPDELVTITVTRVRPDAVGASWQKFFEGQWVRKSTSWNLKDGDKSDVADWTHALHADGRAGITQGKWRDSGDQFVLVSGWTDSVPYFEHGVASHGNRWSIDFHSQGRDVLVGVAQGVVNGEEAFGPVTIRKTGPDSYTADAVITNAKGEVVLKAHDENQRKASQ